MEIPEPLRPYVQTISIDELGGVRAEKRLERIDENLYHLRLTFDLQTEAAQDDWRVKITPAFQQFEWNGKKVGAPVFIVNVTQSPNYPCPISEREFRSVWNQAWFSSLRSVSGLYRYGRRTKNKDLMDKALLTKDLALAAPMKDGLFDTVIATEMEMVEIEGKQYKRSKGYVHSTYHPVQYMDVLVRIHIPAAY